MFPTRSRLDPFQCLGLKIRLRTNTNRPVNDTLNRTSKEHRRVRSSRSFDQGWRNPGDPRSLTPWIPLCFFCFPPDLGGFPVFTLWKLPAVPQQKKIRKPDRLVHWSIVHFFHKISRLFTTLSPPQQSQGVMTFLFLLHPPPTSIVPLKSKIYISLESLQRQDLSPEIAKISNFPLNGRHISGPGHAALCAKCMSCCEEYDLRGVCKHVLTAEKVLGITREPTLSGITITSAPAGASDDYQQRVLVAISRWTCYNHDGELT